MQAGVVNAHLTQTHHLFAPPGENSRARKRERERELNFSIHVGLMHLPSGRHPMTFPSPFYGNRVEGWSEQSNAQFGFDIK